MMFEMNQDQPYPLITTIPTRWGKYYILLIIFVVNYKKNNY